MRLDGLLPGGEPFHTPGDETGCLLSHGWTGAPQEVRWLGQHLAGQGYTVHGVRLAGHGTTPRDMGRTHWRDWYASLLGGYQLLRQTCERVFVLGLSMGAALSLLLAANEEVSGVVSMASPYRLSRLKVRAASVLRPVLFSVPANSSGDFSRQVAAEQARRGERVTGHVAYGQRPLCAVVQLAALLEEARRALPQVRVPALLIHARHDTLIPLGSMQRIYDALGSADKRTLTLERGGHVVTEDVDHPLVFEAAAEFIAAHL
jgi:carboxylesterase